MTISRTSDTDFDAFWAKFPRRKSKGDARKAWLQTAAIRPPLPELLAAIDAASRSPQWQRDGGQYIPYPATWLRAEGWEDEHQVNLAAAAPQRAWHETAGGLEQRGRELGLFPQDFAHFPAFKVAVMQAHRREANPPQSNNVVTLARRA